MLAKENRGLTVAEFRNTLRKGRKVSTGHFVVAVRDGNTVGVNRFGVIVSKQVAKSAVSRNLVRRRVQAVCAEFAVEGAKDVIVRALPGAETLTSAELTAELKAFKRLMK